MTIKKNLSLIGILALAGCSNPGPSFTDGCPAADLKDRPQPDLLPPEAKCKAAQGLSGDNLICVDFDKVTSLTDPSLAGWNFNANTAGCWQISGGFLQVQNFATTPANCGLTLQPLDFKQPDKQNYQRATLSLVYRLMMNDNDQKAQIFMDFDDQSTRLLYQITGTPSMAPLATTTLTVNKADLLPALQSVYKFFLKSVSPTGRGGQGWQIQSIAVNATQ